MSTQKITIVQDVPSIIFGRAVWPMHEEPWAMLYCKRYGKRFKLAYGRFGYRSYVAYTHLATIYYTPWFDRWTGKFVGYRREIVRSK